MKTLALLLLVSLSSQLAAAPEVDRHALKEALKRAGFYEGPVAGAHPEKVKAAIKRYEQAHGLPVTGEVSDALLQGLGLTSQPAGVPGNAAAPPPAAAAPNESHRPSARLSQFMSAHVDKILSPIDRPVQLPREEAVQMREHFADEMAKAPDPQKPIYKQAWSVTNAIIGAMDEREKAIVAARPSSMPGVQDTHDARVSVRRHAGRAAVQSEKYENAQDHRAANEKSNFLEEAAAKQWADRTVVLRQNIDHLYALEREAERQAQMSP